MADYTQLMNLEKKQKGQMQTPPPQQSTTPQSVSTSMNQSTRRSIIQSTKQLTKQSTTRSDNKIVEKPKGFYITQRLDKKLDEAVRYLQDVHGIKKADRSTLVNAILDNEANWTEESLDLLIDRVINLLTSRLMG